MFDKHKGNKPQNDSAPAPVASHSAPATPTPSAPAAGKAAVIGPGIIVKGDISGTDNLVIEGKVTGSVKLASHEVSIGPSGEVNADVAARLIRIAGKVHGDIEADERVVISKTGNVRGNITAPRVMLEDGAIFKGSIDMDPGDAAVVKSAVAQSRPAAKPAPVPEAVSDTSDKAPDLSLKSG